MNMKDFISFEALKILIRTIALSVTMLVAAITMIFSHATDGLSSMIMAMAPVMLAGFGMVYAEIKLSKLDDFIQVQAQQENEKI